MSLISEERSSVRDPTDSKGLRHQSPSAGFGMAGIKAALLTGGQDRHYVVGLATALLARGVPLEVIGSDEVDCPELHASIDAKFLNLRGNQGPSASLLHKVQRVLLYYYRIMKYAVVAEPKLFHILWNNKFEYFDRTVLMWWYRLCGRHLVITAHNVNQGRRDGTDSVINRLTLRVQYHCAEHIFVHTDLMKQELLSEFSVPKSAITVIPYGVNNAVPQTGMSCLAAKQHLGIHQHERAMLFFGNIAQYKGLDLLADAFRRITVDGQPYRLIIAGKPKRGSELYIQGIQELLGRQIERGQVVEKLRHVDDNEAEIYFKAADVLVLPYRDIFQSGVLFLGYSFGLPCIATDVGSMRSNIIEGETGFICQPGDSQELVRAIEAYFQSDLYRNLPRRRAHIQGIVNTKHSWDHAGSLTRDVYSQLLL